jgi:hypothetical protein
MRRPNMLLFNNWMGECFEKLVSSPKILDKRLAACVTLQRILDEASTLFGFDDPSTNISLTESRVQVIMKGFEKRMEEWMANAEPGVMNSASFPVRYCDHR